MNDLPEGYTVRDQMDSERLRSSQWPIKVRKMLMNAESASVWFSHPRDRMGYFIVLADDGWYVIDAVQILPMEEFKVASGPFDTAAGAMLAVKVFASV